MIFTAFSENFLSENKLCGWLFTDLHNSYALSWPLANFPDFSLVKKNHISFIIIYVTIFYYSFSLIMSVHDNTLIDTFWAVLWLSQMPQIMFRRSGQSYVNATQTIANDLDDWDHLYRSLELSWDFWETLYISFTEIKNLIKNLQLYLALITL